jgi:hypothetical protein
VNSNNVVKVCCVRVVCFNILYISAKDEPGLFRGDRKNFGTLQEWVLVVLGRQSPGLSIRIIDTVDAAIKLFPYKLFHLKPRRPRPYRNFFSTTPTEHIATS